MPGRIGIYTSPDGTSSPIERMRIDCAGNVGVGTTAASRLHVVSITEQLRIGYDATKYASLTVDSTGLLTVTPILGCAISANSASVALRVTQTGSGDALRIEDSANPDASPFVIDGNGNVFKGSSTSIAVEYPMGFQIHGTGADSSMSIARWAASPGSSSLYLAKSRGATVGARAIVQLNDSLAYINFSADDGVNFVNAAFITGAIDATPAVGSAPGRLVFATTPSGGASPIERMRIDNSGNVVVGITAASARLHAVSTTEQLRLGYDATKYASFLVDTNGDLTITPAGGTSNKVCFGTWASNADAAVNGYITIKDAGGTTRKLATIA
jgi:hypothetical protein